MDFTEFYSQYLGCEGDPNSEGFVSCQCVFHADKKASAGYNTTTGVYCCFACGADEGKTVKTWSPAGFLVEHEGFSWIEASRIVDSYRTEKGLVTRFDKYSKIPMGSRKFDILATEAVGLLSPDRQEVIEYAKTRNIPYDTLVRLGVGWLPAKQTNWKRDSLVFPYTVNGKVVGIRYRDISGNKWGEPGSIMQLWGIDSVNDQTKTIVIVEGESDCLRVASAYSDQPEVAVLSTPTCAFALEWGREFLGISEQILLPQSDRASLALIKGAKETLGSKLKIVTLPWKRRQYGKDVCDWMNYNDDEQLRGLLNTGRAQKTMTGHDLTRIADERGPMQPLIDGLLFREQIGIVVGMPKFARKTWFVLNMARTIMQPGQPFLDIDTMVGPSEPGNVFIIEEEGPLSDLAKRARLAFKDIPTWEDQSVWWHNRGVKIDDPSWIAEISGVIYEHKIDLLILDCMQRLHSADDENSASKMAPFWDNLHQLVGMHPQLGIVLIHHFNREGIAAAKWNAVRGSSRTDGEVDLAIFLEPTKFCAVNRSAPPLESPEGEEMFPVSFDQNTGIFKCTNAVAHVDRDIGFMIEMARRGAWSRREAIVFMGVHPSSLARWIEKYKEFLKVQDGVIHMVKQWELP